MPMLSLNIKIQSAYLVPQIFCACVLQNDEELQEANSAYLVAVRPVFDVCAHGARGLHRGANAPGGGEAY